MCEWGELRKASDLAPEEERVSCRHRPPPPATTTGLCRCLWLQSSLEKLSRPVNSVAVLRTCSSRDPLTNRGKEDEEAPPNLYRTVSGIFRYSKLRTSVRRPINTRFLIGLVLPLPP